MWCPGFTALSHSPGGGWMASYPLLLGLISREAASLEGCWAAFEASVFNSKIRVWDVCAGAPCGGSLPLSWSSTH